MEAMVSARVTILQALREGPSYGQALRRLVLDRTGGRVRLGHGNLYAVLADLQRARLVRTWTVLPGGRRGARSRRYYELTPRGLHLAQAHGMALGPLFAVPAPPPPSTEHLELMRERLLACEQVSGAAHELRDAMLRLEAGQ
jgi:DNA-binding PadR family transcriptional regulator